jgi:hypothetical protein
LHCYASGDTEHGIFRIFESPDKSFRVFKLFLFWLLNELQAIHQSSRMNFIDCQVRNNEKSRSLIGRPTLQNHIPKRRSQMTSTCQSSLLGRRCDLAIYRMNQYKMDYASCQIRNFGCRSCLSCYLLVLRNTSYQVRGIRICHRFGKMIHGFVGTYGAYD